MLIKLKQSDDRVQMRGERWKQKDGLSPNPKKMDSPPTLLQERGKPDSPPTPLQERGIVTTGKRGLSVLAIPEHPLSPPVSGGQSAVAVKL